MALGPRGTVTDGNTKICSGPCGRRLPLDEKYFNRDADKTTGFKSQCRECRNNARRAGRKASTVEQPRKWHFLERFDAGIDDEFDYSDVGPGLELERSAFDPLPAPPVPPYFSVCGVSTQLDDQGNLEKQWLDSRRDGEAFEPIQAAIPAGHALKGISTLVDERGNVRAQWIKTKRDDGVDLEAAMFEAVSRLADAWPSRATLVEPPTHSDDDLLAVYPMGDPHIGMLAWEKETGENFDLGIAERNLVAAVDHLVALAPPARRALVLTVGDTLHSDGLFNTTTKGTRVDVDGRTAKMITVAIRTFRRIIDRALEKHEIVEVKIARGNHDELLSLVLSIALQMYYEHEPRVHVDPSPQMFHWYRFGLNLIGVTHGDKAKPMDLMGVMANDCAKDWGETKHRKIYAGHIHHDVVKEVPGVIIEHLRTLASKDAWHAGMGYRSGRDMKMDVIHRVHGHINRHIVGIQQLLTPRV